MSRFVLRLPQRQARLAALAVSYHLARPGSELDPQTLAAYQHGLTEIAPKLEEKLGDASATIELGPLQVELLSTALSSVISELKMYSLFDTMSGSSGRPRSTAPGFDQRLRELFPEVALDPSLASELAKELTMLRRQLPTARAREVLEEQRRAAEAGGRTVRKWWQFWRTGGGS
jgi:hypothetical protein